MAKLKVTQLPIPKLLITPEDVKNTKPHPEFYLLAASKLGIRPEKCLVFEDFEAGIMSAQSAGMPAVQVTFATHMPLNPYAKANLNNFEQMTFIYNSKTVEIIIL